MEFRSHQPVKLRDGSALELIRRLDPELIVVAAYGRILPDEILNVPPKGCINVHSSLLPKYRGAAPINWAVLNGDTVTGVTIMHMAHDLDAGDIIDMVSTPIGPDENAEALYGRLARLGAELLGDVVQSIQAGRAARTPQDDAQATLAPMLTSSFRPSTGPDRPRTFTTRSGDSFPGRPRLRNWAESAVKYFQLLYCRRAPPPRRARFWRLGKTASVWPAAAVLC